MKFYTDFHEILYGFSLHFIRILLKFYEDFHEILYGFSWNFISYFSKIVEKVQVSLQSNNNKRYFTRRPMYVSDHISILLSITNVSDKICRQNQNTNLCSVASFPKIVLFMTMWGNNVELEQATDDNKIRRMRITCWVPKATNTHAQYVGLPL